MSNIDKINGIDFVCPQIKKAADALKKKAIEMSEAMNSVSNDIRSIEDLLNLSMIKKSYAYLIDNNHSIMWSTDQGRLIYTDDSGESLIQKPLMECKYVVKQSVQPYLAELLWVVVSKSNNDEE